MKKFCITLLLIGIILLTTVAAVNGSSTKTEFLRIHVRANSNGQSDQAIKYEIKDLIVNFLTPCVSEVSSKSEAISVLEANELKLENLVGQYLAERGFKYGCNVSVRNEKFPTRVYENYTLEEGYYDALIVELGKAEGDNWWCVVYPPLCFTSGEGGIEYKSKILEVIKDFEKKYSA